MGNRIKHRPKNLLQEFKEKQKQTEPKEEYIEKETGGLLCSFNEDAIDLPKNEEQFDKFKENISNFKKCKQVKKTNIKFIF